MGEVITEWKDNTVTGEAVRDYLDNDIVIGYCSALGYDATYLSKLHTDDMSQWADGFATSIKMAINKQGGDTYSYGQGFIYNVRTYLNAPKPNARIIGHVVKENSDGSLQIALYGDDISMNLAGFKRNRLDIRAVARVDTYFKEPGDLRLREFPQLLTFLPTDHTSGYSAYMWYTKNNANNSVLNGYDVDLSFTTETSLSYADSNFIGWHCLQNKQPMGTNRNIHLSKDDNTFCLGLAYNTRYQNFKKYSDMSMGGIDHCINGDIYDVIMETYYRTIMTYSGYKLNMEDGYYGLYDFPAIVVDDIEYAQMYKLFNVPLTYSQSGAMRYLQDGTLPDDVFLFPFNLANLPTSDGTIPSGDDKKPPSGEDGDSGIDGTPTTDADPQITSNMLTNNNLYWLQAGQLEAFITWFWQNAGEIIELDDLWDRIKGLYNDLASAIINIRYFPVDPYYIGGVSDTTNIVLSSIEMPISGIKKLNKTKLRKRTLGEITIQNRYNAFTDYSPYTSLMLYLPFHGWIDLDIDIFTGNKLQVRCVYDHISGTIQYGVYVISKGKEFLLNTVIAKMAVDIPITLQSKNDRDSAIFNNVTNAFGNLLGAGASAVTGNPIGLVMSTAGVASSGTQSAPLKVNGTVGETGAFFMPNKCAVYIKRPSYNRPKNYGSRVGFPSNKGGKLSSFSGFTTVYNPQITFSGNTNADNVTIKPLQSEIDEIYSALEKGVII